MPLRARTLPEAASLGRGVVGRKMGATLAPRWCLKDILDCAWCHVGQALTSAAAMWGHHGDGGRLGFTTKMRRIPQGRARQEGCGEEIKTHVIY